MKIVKSKSELLAFQKYFFPKLFRDFQHVFLGLPPSAARLPSTAALNFSILSIQRGVTRKERTETAGLYPFRLT